MYKHHIEEMLEKMEADRKSLKKMKRKLIENKKSSEEKSGEKKDKSRDEYRKFLETPVSDITFGNNQKKKVSPFQEPGLSPVYELNPLGRNQQN